MSISGDESGGVSRDCATVLEMFEFYSVELELFLIN
jgi:hypothetical protein